MVSLRQLNRQDSTLDPNAPTRRERGIDPEAEPPGMRARGRGTATGTPTAGATTTTGTTGSSVAVDSAPSSPLDRAERVTTTRAEDPELRAILDNAPPLPSSGTYSLGRAERGALDDFLARTNDGDAALLWESMMTMANSAQQDMEASKRLKNLLQSGKIDNKKAETRSVERQGAADRRSSAFNLTMSIASTAASYAGYKYGESVGGAAGGQSMGYAVSQAASTLINTGGQYLNKVAGPQREMDKEKVRQARLQMQGEIFEQGIENAKANYDEAREGMKLALKILTEHAERQTQISTTITRI